MPETTAKIRAKGCEKTGLDEDLALKLHGKPGTYLMAIVELKVQMPHGPDAEGKRAVDLVITGLEPVTDADGLDEHVRLLQRRLYHDRQLHSEERDGQLSISTQSDVEPSVEEVMQAGKRHEPHDYIQAPGEADNQVCDVCGKPEFAQLHHAGDEPERDEPDDDADESEE